MELRAGLPSVVLDRGACGLRLSLPSNQRKNLSGKIWRFRKFLLSVGQQGRSPGDSAMCCCGEKAIRSFSFLSPLHTHTPTQSLTLTAGAGDGEGAEGV